MKKNTLYVAYGSNLNVPQMKYRCPDARHIEAGIIEDYRLEFKALGAYAYATIAPCAGDYVPVVVWEISPSDEKRLDIYEGFPTHYFKERVWVTLDSGRIEAMVYVMNEKAHIQAPEEHYVQTIAAGYDYFGLEQDKLEQAIQRVKKNFKVYF